MNFFSLLHSWIDCLFPPLCEICHTPSARELLCKNCWGFCAPLDPRERCVHCFGDLDAEVICGRCRKEPLISHPHAFVFESCHQTRRICKEAQEKPLGVAAFAFYQWERLNWPTPDAILPFLDAKSFVEPFAEIMGVPWIHFLQKWNRDAAILEEDCTFLLLGLQSSWTLLRDAGEELNGAFPKKIYSLSLLHDDSTCYSSSDFRHPSSLRRDVHRPSAASLDRRAPR